MKLSINACRTAQSLDLLPLIAAIAANGFDLKQPMAFLEDRDFIPALAAETLDAECEEYAKLINAECKKADNVFSHWGLKGTSGIAIASKLRANVAKFGDGKVLAGGNRRLRAASIAELITGVDILSSKCFKLLTPPSVDSLAAYEELEFSLNDESGALAPDESAVYKRFIRLANEASDNGRLSVNYLAISRKIWPFSYESKSTLRGKYSSCHKVLAMGGELPAYDQLKSIKAGQLNDLLEGPLTGKGKERDASMAVTDAAEMTARVAELLAPKAEDPVLKEHKDYPSLVNELIKAGVTIRKSQAIAAGIY